jgi:hypothetical protein
LGEKQELGHGKKEDKTAERLTNLGIKATVMIERGIPFREILR